MVNKEKLKQLREKRGLSCRAASELCGLTSGAIRRYEIGDHTPTVAALEAIADFYKVSILYLLDRE